MDAQRAKELISVLADGVDPLTGEVLDDGDVCNKPEVIRALHMALDALEKELKRKTRKQPENAGKPWTDEQDAELCRMYDAGSTKSEINRYFKRTDGAISSRLVRLGKIRDRYEY